MAASALGQIGPNYQKWGFEYNGGRSTRSSGAFPCLLKVGAYGPAFDRPLSSFLALSSVPNSSTSSSSARMAGTFSGLLTIQQVIGRDLPAEDIGGTSDPYFVLMYVRSKHRTSMLLMLPSYPTEDQFKSEYIEKVRSFMQALIPPWPHHGR